MIKVGKIYSLLLIALLSLQTFSFLFTSFATVASTIDENADSPPLVHWKELWNNFKPIECNFREEDYGDFEAPSWNPKGIMEGSEGSVEILRADGYRISNKRPYQWTSEDAYVREDRFTFYVFDSENSAMSLMPKIREKSIEDCYNVLNYGMIPPIEGTNLEVEETHRDPLSGEYEASQYERMRAGPSTIYSTGYIGKHLVMVIERYKTVVIRVVAYVAGWTNPEGSSKFETSLFELYIDEMEDVARRIVDERVRILRFDPYQWFEWDPDNPLVVKVNVEEKLPSVGEIGLKTSDRFKEWTWQVPEKPVLISLRLFRYDLKEKPISEKYEHLIKTYWYLTFEKWIWEDPIKIPTISVGDKNENCLIFDTDHAPTEYLYNTEEKGFVDVNLISGIMVREPLKKTLVVDWALNFNDLTKLLNPTIRDSDRHGDIGATIQAAAYIVNENDEKVILTESDFKQVKVTHVAEVVGTRQPALEKTYGIHVWGKAPSGNFRLLMKRFGKPVDTNPKPKYGTEAYAPNYPKPRFPLLPGDLIFMGRHDAIVVWYPLIQQKWSVSSNFKAMGNKEYTSFMIFPEPSLSSGRKKAVWITQAGVTLLVSALSSKLAWYYSWTIGIAAGEIAGETAGTIYDKVSPDETVWTDVTTEGTIIGFDTSTEDYIIYLLEGKAKFQDEEGNEITLDENEMTTMSYETRTLSSPESFDTDYLPFTLQYLLSEERGELPPEIESELEIEPEHEAEQEKETEPEPETAPQSEFPTSIRVGGWFKYEVDESVSGDEVDASLTPEWIKMEILDFSGEEVTANFTLHYPDDFEETAVLTWYVETGSELWIIPARCYEGDIIGDWMIEATLTEYYLSENRLVNFASFDESYGAVTHIIDAYWDQETGILLELYEEFSSSEKTVYTSYVMTEANTWNPIPLQLWTDFSSYSVIKGGEATISARVSDDEGNPVEGATVIAAVSDTSTYLYDLGEGHYEGTIDTEDLNVRTYMVDVTAYKDGYQPIEASLTLEVKRFDLTSWILYGGIATVGIVIASAMIYRSRAKKSSTPKKQILKRPVTPRNGRTRTKTPTPPTLQIEPIEPTTSTQAVTQEPLYCRWCGSKLRLPARFCEQCGREIE